MFIVLYNHDLSLVVGISESLSVYINDATVNALIRKVIGSRI